MTVEFWHVSVSYLKRINLSQHVLKELIQDYVKLINKVNISDVYTFKLRPQKDNSFTYSTFKSNSHINKTLRVSMRKKHNMTIGERSLYLSCFLRTPFTEGNKDLYMTDLKRMLNI